jgi:cytochrome c553
MLAVSLLIPLLWAGVVAQQPDRQQIDTISVILAEHSFDLTEVTVTVGSPIELLIRNDDEVTHTLAAAALGIADLALPAGATITIPLTAPWIEGEYFLTCIDCAVRGETLPRLIVDVERPLLVDVVAPAVYGAAVASFEIVLAEHAFELSEITVTAGSPIELLIRNDDEVTHSIASTALGIAGVGVPGQQTVTIRLSSPQSEGEYLLTCGDCVINGKAMPPLIVDVEPLPTDLTAVTEFQLLTLGEEIFQRTAGGIGCATCHGPQATGSAGPDIRGQDRATIQGALRAVPDMGFIALSEEQLDAVAAYLATLHPGE